MSQLHITKVHLLRIRISSTQKGLDFHKYGLYYKVKTKLGELFIKS